LQPPPITPVLAKIAVTQRAAPFPEKQLPFDVFCVSASHGEVKLVGKAAVEANCCTMATYVINEAGDI
jgi:hypothetical protein